jgi:hypothetical protein
MGGSSLIGFMDNAEYRGMTQNQGQGSKGHGHGKEGTGLLHQ